MSKDKKQFSNMNKDKEELDCNGDPIDPKREYIGNKVKVPMPLQTHQYTKPHQLSYSEVSQ